MKYTESHEWINLDNNIGTVGITDHAQDELGDIVYVELPEVGKKVQAGDEVVVLESTKAAADIYAPVSGTITEVNTLLLGSAELVNQSAQGDGWLFRLELDNPKELDKLLEADAYHGMVG